MACVTCGLISKISNSRHFDVSPTGLEKHVSKYLKMEKSKIYDFILPQFSLFSLFQLLFHYTAHLEMTYFRAAKLLQINEFHPCHVSFFPEIYVFLIRLELKKRCFYEKILERDTRYF